MIERDDGCSFVENLPSHSATMLSKNSYDNEQCDKVIQVSSE